MASLRVILAWGNHGAWKQQDIYTLELLKSYNYLYSLGMTKQGCPRHPLYVRRTTKPEIYSTAIMRSLLRNCIVMLRSLIKTKC